MRRDVQTNVPGLVRDAANPNVVRASDLSAWDEIKFKRRLLADVAALREEVDQLRARVAALGDRP